MHIFWIPYAITAYKYTILVSFTVLNSKKRANNGSGVDTYLIIFVPVSTGSYIWINHRFYTKSFIGALKILTLYTF